jgi:hypothetical protein
MKPTIKIEGVSVFIIGTFNPQIFQPQWFAKQKLIRSSEADEATVEVITKDASVFSIGWAGVQITRDQAVFSSNQPQQYELVRDLVAATFRVLKHTPLTRFAITWASHFEMADKQSWHKIGHKFAPKEPWKDILQNPGMLDVTMMSAREGDLRGRDIVTIQPSVNSNIQNGVYTQITNEYELANPAHSETPCESMLRILNSQFQGCLDRRASINDKLLVL